MKRAHQSAEHGRVEELGKESTRREENWQVWREYERHLERVHMDLLNWVFTS